MSSVDDIKKYEFKRTLEELERYEGRGTQLISLYIPPDRQISDVMAYLRDEYSTAGNIKSKGTRKNVLAALESIMSRLKYFKKPPENGLVIFTGHVQKRGDQTEMVSYIIEPLEPITSFLYRCDSKFYIEPLKEMLSEKEIYGLIVIDRKEATIGILRGTRIEVVKQLESMVPSKHHQGGQSSRRFERLIELAVHEFFKKVGEIASEVFLSEQNLLGVFVGGPGGTKEEFLKKDYLHHEIRKKVLDVIDVGYTDEVGLREMVDKISQKVKDIKISKEKEILSRFLGEIKKGSGKAIYGENEVVSAIERGAVEILLLSDSIRKFRVIYRCPSCGKTIEETSADVEEKVCDSCGILMEVASKEDVIEKYAETVKEKNGEVRLITSESEEGKLFLRAFNGIGAILRYST